MTSQILIHLQLYFSNYLTVGEIDDALGIGGIALRVSDHHDGGTFLMQLAEEVHHFATILRIQVTCWLVGKNELGT